MPKEVCLIRFAFQLTKSSMKSSMEDEQHQKILMPTDFFKLTANIAVADEKDFFHGIINSISII